MPKPMIRPLIVAEPEGILEGLSRPSAAPPERTRIIANPYDDSRIGVFAISPRACAALSFTAFERSVVGGAPLGGNITARGAFGI